MNEIALSVIVPIYNVGEYLEPCLNSIVNQTFIENIEVIMVDDGSTDNSGEVAKQFEKEYPNFHYYYKENGGLGQARNYGVQFANGKYIAFVDSDDLLAADMYEKMFTYAERNNSDLTICNVVRFNSKSIWASNLHKLLFYNLKLNTHITETPRLVYDTTSWNKLIRRDFYIKNNFSFPENILYEDIPVTIPMHFKANNVSVVESTYYYWRVRDGASKSITQNSDKLDNLNDRLTVLKMLSKFLKENHADENILIEQQKKILEIDLMIFVNNCKSVPENLAYEIMDIINKYIEEEIDESTFPLLALINQAKYNCVRERNLEKLIKLIDYKNNGYYNAVLEEKNGRFLMTAPDELFTMSTRDVTSELAYTEPRKFIRDITVTKDSIEILGHIYKHRLNISDFSQQKITAYLENEMTQALTELSITPVDNHKTTVDRGTAFDKTLQNTSYYNYDGTGFKITVDLNSLEINESNQGFNKILICYENRVSSGMLRLGTTGAPANDSAAITDNKYARVKYDALKEIRIFVKAYDNFAEGFKIDDNKIFINLENKVEQLFVKTKKDEVIYFDTSDNKSFYIDFEALDKNTTYYAYTQNKNEQPQWLLFREKRIFVESNDNKNLIIRTNKNNQVRITSADTLTLANKIESADNKIRFNTEININDDLKDITCAKIFVNDKISGIKDILAISKVKNNASNTKATAAFEIDFNNKKVTKNLYNGTRDIFIAYYDSRKNEILSELIFSKVYHKSVITFDTFELTFFRGVNGSLRLKASSLWPVEENTVQKRNALIAQNYPEYRKAKINPKRIVFESMWGGKYSCNPQHLYEYIDKNYPEYECIWSLKDERTPIKGKGIRVRRGSQEYYKYLATAKYFVNNVNFETNYVKRKGQIEVQTMHGTPLKTLGLDVADDFPNEQSKVQYIEKNGRWNYLLVQGEFMKNKAYDCFRFNKKILKSGYPRTDVLFNATEEEKNNIKKQLGVPLDKKVILYTPTWRKKGSFDMELDIEKMREKLSDEYVLLVRLHHLCAPKNGVACDYEFLFDLHLYRSVEDLYLISDILITDYSSVMFDYALLNKPMLFFMYDLEDYRDNLRGLYVDIEKEAPGPIVFDTDEVIDAIENIDQKMQDCSQKIVDFKNKYLTYENDNSCAMIVNKVLKPNSLSNKCKKLKKRIKRKMKTIAKK